MNACEPLTQNEQVVQVVRHSTSVNNAFISTVDHLPCDVIRSIWFVQSCNLAIDKLQQKVRSLGNRLSSKQNAEIKQEIISQYLTLKMALEQNSREAKLESQALYNQVVNHKKQLSGELEQLQSVIQVLEHLTQAQGKQLKEQLVKHYEKHPLESQKEAQAAKASLGVSDGVSDANTPLKLILKLPKSKKLKKLGQNGKNGKNGKVNKILAGKTTKLLKKTIATQKVQVPKLDFAQVEEVDNTPYCFCHQPSFGDMIGCDNEESCPNGDWFHYKCVGLLNRVDALKYVTGKQKWYCSKECQKIASERQKREKQVKEKKKKGRKSKR